MIASLENLIAATWFMLYPPKSAIAYTTNEWGFIISIFFVLRISINHSFWISLAKVVDTYFKKTYLIWYEILIILSSTKIYWIIEQRAMGQTYKDD